MSKSLKPDLLLELSAEDTEDELETDDTSRSDEDDTEEDDDDDELDDFDLERELFAFFNDATQEE